MVIQNAIATGTQIGQALASRAATASAAAATSGANSAAALSASGGWKGTLAGLVGGAAAALPLERVRNDQQQLLPNGRIDRLSVSSATAISQADKDDLTGDKAVQMLLRKQAT